MNKKLAPKADHSRRSAIAELGLARGWYLGLAYLNKSKSFCQTAQSNEDESIDDQVHDFSRV
jgi:hypothetical protein